MYRCVPVYVSCKRGGFEIINIINSAKMGRNDATYVSLFCVALSSH